MPFAAGPNPFTRIRADVRLLARGAREAQAKALTFTAQDVKAAQEAELRRAIDRPTPYTLGGVYYLPATAANLEAVVALKDDYSPHSGHTAANYLAPQIQGGGRQVKAFEKLLQLSGAMPQGWKAVPGKAARLDAYGNVSTGQIIQVLSQLRLTLTAGYTRNLPLRQRALRGADGKLGELTKEQKAINAARRRAFVRAGGRFFVVKPGEDRKLLPGIYQGQVLGKRTAGPTRRFPLAVFIFVPRATYRRRVDWDQVAERTIDARLPYHLERQLERAGF